MTPQNIKNNILILLAGAILTQTVIAGGGNTKASYALPVFIGNLACMLLWIAPLILTLLIVIGGFFYMLGDPVKKNQGKKIIVNAIIGFIIIVGLISLSTVISPGIDMSECLDNAPIRNKDPVADARVSYKSSHITYKFAHITIGNTAYFDGSGSYDPDGSIVRYTWDLGDGTILTGETPEHTYAIDGTYYAILKVEDNEGEISVPSTVIVIVNPHIEVHVGGQE
jgi:hypothetical protein